MEITQEPQDGKAESTIDHGPGGCPPNSLMMKIAVKMGVELSKEYGAVEIEDVRMNRKTEEKTDIIVHFST